MILTRILLLYTAMELFNSLEVIPERPGVTYVDHFYLEWANVSVKRYGRRSRYYMNFEARTKQAWGNNVTTQLIFYEFLSNEYRRSFIEYRAGACNFLREPYIGHAMARSLKGRTCPYPAGDYHFMNITPTMENFKFKWPFEKARVDISIFDNHRGNITIASGFVLLTFKQKP